MSWEQLRSIVQQDAQERAYWAGQRPRACPNDGTPLLEGPPSQPGVLFCSFDGWQYPRDYDADSMSGM